MFFPTRFWRPLNAFGGTVDANFMTVNSFEGLPLFSYHSLSMTMRFMCHSALRCLNEYRAINVAGRTFIIFCLVNRLWRMSSEVMAFKSLVEMVHHKPLPLEISQSCVNKATQQFLWIRYRLSCKILDAGKASLGDITYKIMTMWPYELWVMLIKWRNTLGRWCHAKEHTNHLIHHNTAL